LVIRRQSSLVRKYQQLFSKADFLDRTGMEPHLERFLKQHPNYAPALRLRGLLLDYELAREAANERTLSSDDPRFEQMRESYEAALKADPHYTLVLIDLGDYWSDRANPQKALEYYDRALRLLKGGHFSDDRDEELEAAYRGKIEALIAMGDCSNAEECRKRALTDCVQNEYFRNLDISS
jgi:tetratricopeptide (TPR) repeat protein